MNDSYAILLGIIVCLNMMHISHANNKTKTVIFVVGMHRSGTSVTAGILYYLDIYAGNDLMGIAHKNKSYNKAQKGAKLPLYPKFEHRPTYLLNEAFLSRFNASWHNITNFSLDTYRDPTVFYTYIERAWAHDLLTQSVFFVKDPRLSLLLPLYISFAKSKGYNPKIIIVKRNLREIAMSVSRRSSFLSFDQSYTLAEKYYQFIEQYSKGYDVLTLCYTDILHNLKYVLKKLRTFLKLPPITKQQKKKLEKFIRKNLCHFNSTNMDKLI